MKKYAKVEDETTKRCSVATGTNIDFYKSIGMEELDVEQGFDGWYLLGYAPEKPPEIVKRDRIIELKGFLAAADYWGQKYIDGEYTEAEWNEKKAQRKALAEQRKRERQSLKKENELLKAKKYSDDGENNQ